MEIDHSTRVLTNHYLLAPSLLTFMAFLSLQPILEIHVFVSVANLMQSTEFNNLLLLHFISCKRSTNYQVIIRSFLTYYQVIPGFLRNSEKSD